RVFVAAAKGERPSGPDVAVVNEELGRALAHARVVPDGGGYALAWVDPLDGPVAELDAPLWPIVRSAMEVLVEADLDRIGECESDTCGFLFLDVT
ncbi:MAG: hypothetical protein GWN71_06840, partial [Gammaproteobacteria bacterium]|nr:hypothetical protein [Gemmatimonadota bacterium]NIU73297.1 hypothetical protein [Gammaproteobacteria bacterium]NIY07736.1 hypothetical protein [Gemmatimonadota bacterium]